MPNGDQVYVNPKTGERIQWSGKAWVPVKGESSFDKLTASDNPLDPVTGQPKGGAVSRTLSSAGGSAIGFLPGMLKMLTGEMTPEEAKTYLGHEATPKEIAAL